MEKIKSYQDKSIEIDTKDVSNGLDKSVEIKKSMQDDKRNVGKQIVDTAKRELNKLKSSFKKLSQSKDDKTIVPARTDTRYEEMKQQKNNDLQDIQIESNKRQLEKAREVTQQARERQILIDKLKKTKQKSKNRDRSR